MNIIDELERIRDLAGGNGSISVSITQYDHCGSSCVTYTLYAHSDGECFIGGFNDKNGIGAAIEDVKAQIERAKKPKLEVVEGGEG